MSAEISSTSTSNVDAINIEARILEICAENELGLSDTALRTAIPTTSTELRAAAINRLVSQGKIELLKRGQQPVYRLKNCSPAAALAFKGAEQDEKLVYQIIEKAGDKGIWIRDIRGRSNLPLNQVSKLLKSLENKKIIKSITPIHASKKKMYMLYNLEPSASVTGGAWYSDQEFETEFVGVLNDQCHRFLQQALTAVKGKDLGPIVERTSSFRSSEEVWKFITALKISKVELTRQDIESILSTLVYDGKVEKTCIPGRGDMYRVLHSEGMSDFFTTLPCSICAVVDDCHVGGEISPATCIYFQEQFNY